MVKGKVIKKKAMAEHRQLQMRLVTSEVCGVCKTPCDRGMSYFRKMSEPGAVGTGVPCVLTLGK